MRFEKGLKQNVIKGLSFQNSFLSKFGQYSDQIQTDVLKGFSMDLWLHERCPQGDNQSIAAGDPEEHLLAFLVGNIARKAAKSIKIMQTCFLFAGRRCQRNVDPLRQRQMQQGLHENPRSL